MKETVYHYSFTDDNPGDIVEALNTDREYMMYELDDSGGIIIVIKPTGIDIKIIET